MSEDGVEQVNLHSWTEYEGPLGIFIMCNDRSSLENIPDPSRFENEVVESVDEQRKLIAIINFFYWNLAEEDEEMKARAYIMRIEGESPETIAKELGLNRATIYRYFLQVEKDMGDFDILCLEMKDRFEKDNDEISKYVLYKLWNGKQPEEIIRLSNLSRKVVEEAMKKIRSLARRIQKELDDKEQQITRTDTASNCDTTTDGL